MLVAKVMANMSMWLTPTVTVEPTGAIVYTILKNVNQVLERIRMAIKVTAAVATSLTARLLFILIDVTKCSAVGACWDQQCFTIKHHLFVGQSSVSYSTIT